VQHWRGLKSQRLYKANGESKLTICLTPVARMKGGEEWNYNFGDTNSEEVLLNCGSRHYLSGCPSEFLFLKMA